MIWCCNDETLLPWYHGNGGYLPPLHHRINQAITMFLACIEKHGEGLGMRLGCMYMYNVSSDWESETVYLELSLVHCSGVYVFCVKACITGSSSAKHSFTKRCLANRGFPSNWDDTITASKLCPHPPEISFTSCMHTHTNSQTSRWRW